MKTTITVHIPEGSEVNVASGDTITAGSPVAVLTKSSEVITFNLAEILGVSPQKISKYLKRKLGETLGKDEVIAEKKNFMSSVVVKSPQEGVIGEIDLSTGNLIYVLKKEEKKKILSHFPGRVKHITKDKVEIESDTREYELTASSGKKVSGPLYLIKGENIGVLEIGGDIDGTIVLLHGTTEAAVAKMDAIGVKGLISSVVIENVTIPFGLVSKTTFAKLLEEHGRSVILDPESKKLFILES